MATDRFHYSIEKRLGMNSVPLCPDDCPLGAQPPMWYHPAWAGMKAFALPSFSEGYVRLNVRGREERGIVDPADYEAVCEETSAGLLRLTDARTGKPAGAVQALGQPRASRVPHGRGPGLRIAGAWNRRRRMLARRAPGRSQPLLPCRAATKRKPVQLGLTCFRTRP
ncbi:MAG: hypothetical protein M3545_04180 [Acidobacteriota bacterium]|nr:hypothetical protein [Acidobacteriota bacterium]